MAKASKDQLMLEVVSAIKLFQDSVDRFDQAAADFLGINATDLRCLTILNDRGSLPASKVAEALGLTRGATTTALNRVEQAGYVQRSPNAADGRSFQIELTERGRDKIAGLWRPMRTRGRKHMASYAESELRILVRFFTRSIELQESCRAALVEQSSAPGSRKCPDGENK